MRLKGELSIATRQWRTDWLLLPIVSFFIYYRPMLFHRLLSIPIASAGFGRRLIHLILFVSFSFLVQCAVLPDRFPCLQRWDGFIYTIQRLLQQFVRLQVIKWLCIIRLALCSCWWYGPFPWLATWGGPRYIWLRTNGQVCDNFQACKLTWPGDGSHPPKEEKKKWEQIFRISWGNA